LVAAAACLASGPLLGEDLPLTEASSFHFASLAEAKELLGSRDEFALTLSRFDRQVRMQTSEEVTLEQWLEFTAGEARAWTDSEVQRVAAALEDLRPRLARFQFQLPKTILLISTTGKEEADAAYTRQAAIILPQKVLAYPKEQLERLLMHELFHIVSRHDPVLRKKLYAIVGFRPCPEIKLPADWEDRRITNPDAPKIDCSIELKVEAGVLTTAPLLYATPAEYDAQAGGTLFKYLTFKLLVLRRDGDRLIPAMMDDKPVVVDPRGIDDFARQIGKNTNYIVHPDEILADNFVLLLRGNTSVPTPRILEEMAKLLAK
jgi:hypothetical protein